MSVIITFMFDPAKLQMNWASARGTSITRNDRVEVVGLDASGSAIGSDPAMPDELRASITPDGAGPTQCGRRHSR
jgi:hypothetical protein